jgi:hypothetical protein
LPFTSASARAEKTHQFAYGAGGSGDVVRLSRSNS